MSISAGYHVICALIKVGFRLSLIGFRKKVSMTKIKIGSKDAEYDVDEGF
jgi:hypothetical protein